jgi:hypothetical protein
MLPGKLNSDLYQLYINPTEYESSTNFINFFKSVRAFSFYKLNMLRHISPLLENKRFHG